MAKKKQGFVLGALVLMLSNIIVKVIGAFFKIPLANVIGDTAMGYFNSAYSIYSMFFLISTAGLPVAISRMIASSKAKNNYSEADKIYKVSLFIFVILGLIGTSVLFFGADLIAAIPDEPELNLCIRAISPIMFIICVSSCIRGYFQGSQNMNPTAISQVIEVLGNLFIGLTLGVWGTKMGYDAPKVASLVIVGVTSGVLLSAIYLCISKRIAKKDEENLVIEKMESKTGKEIVKELLRISIPITIASSVLSLTSVIDSMVAVRRLKEVGIGISGTAVGMEDLAISIYGAYTSKAVTIFNLPPAIIYPFAISIIPAISSMKAEGNNEKIRETMSFTFRIVSIIALPCAIGICALSKPIIKLLFSANNLLYVNSKGIEVFSNDIAAPMLSILAVAIVFSGLISVSGAMLQAYGFEHLSIISTSCGVVAKLISVYVLVGIENIGAYGIAISTLICYVIMFIFNMFFIKKHINYSMSFRNILLKPLISSAACGAVAVISNLLISSVAPDKIATIIAIVFGGIAYILVLFKSKGISKEDLLQLPKGNFIYKICRKIRLIG